MYVLAPSYPTEALPGGVGAPEATLHESRHLPKKIAQTLVPLAILQATILGHCESVIIINVYSCTCFSICQVRVVDMYIVEGPKIFYRLAISAIKLYTSLAQSAGTSSPSSNTLR